MTVADRRVRSLHVRAPDADRARHAAVLLEDALRVASIPGTTSARVIAIRRLDLGRVPASASSISIALVVEAAAQRIASTAIHAEQPGAASAPVVYFRDQSEVLTILVRRVLRAEPIDEWFWPLVVPSLSPNVPPARVLALAFERARELPAGLALIAQAIASLAMSNVSLPALEQFDVSTASELLRVIGIPGAMRDIEASEIAPVEARAVRVLARWVARWNAAAEDGRVAWLAAMLATAERPTMRVEARVRVVAELVRAAVLLADDPGERGVPARADGKEMVPEAADRWRSNGRSIVNSQTGGAPRRRTDFAPPAQAPVDTIDADLSVPREPLWDTPRRTAHAGLLFAVPLLSRLGIGDLVATRPDLAERLWPDTLLLEIVRHVLPQDDDPAIDWLDPTTLSLANDDRALTAAWIRTLRARAQRDAARPLRTLIARPGAIAATRTHVDVFFLHKHVDIALRRSGLDFDPGWVPWLGRVVQFHYVDALPVDDADA